MINQFESLRIPGIVGKVSHNFNAYIICQRGDNSIQVMEAEIDKGKFAFGYVINFDGNRYSVLPGEKQGWFRSGKDALLYALGYIKSRADRFPDDFKYSIDVAISKLWNVPLFEI